ncbi:hypothetical protein KSC_050610 [Ktedonobacter sp. SOSP1-52]|nr:hypothetical protein KSC_050610 [Ktedonobacter sp. SOSP1-52]
MEHGYERGAGIKGKALLLNQVEFAADLGLALQHMDAMPLCDQVDGGREATNACAYDNNFSSLFRHIYLFWQAFSRPGAAWGLLAPHNYGNPSTRILTKRLNG